MRKARIPQGFSRFSGLFLRTRATTLRNSLRNRRVSGFSQVFLRPAARKTRKKTAFSRKFQRKACRILRKLQVRRQDREEFPGFLGKLSEFLRNLRKFLTFVAKTARDLDS